MRKIIEKHFKGERTLFFHSSDAHKDIEGNTYLTYYFKGDKVELVMGGDNGEICLCVTSNPDKIDVLITNLIL